MAANIFQTGGVDSNWSTNGNWSLGSAPTFNDGNVATFNGTSPNCIVNINATCNGIDFTGYINTITNPNQIQDYGNLTLGSGMSASGNSLLEVIGPATITTNGYVWPGSILLSPNGITATFSLVDNLTSNIFGGVVVGGLALVTGTKSISCNSLQVGCAISSLNCTTLMNGTGTWSGFNYFSMPLTFNTSGTISVIGSIQYGNAVGCSLVYTSGTMITTGSSLFLVTSATPTTLDTSGMTWSNVTAQGGGGGSVITLLSNLNISGNLISTISFNGFTASVSGNFNNTSGQMGGNTKVVLVGTGTIGGQNSNPVELNTSGTVSLSQTNPYLVNSSIFKITNFGAIISTGATFGSRTGAVITCNAPGFSVNSWVSPFNNETTTWNGIYGMTFSAFIGKQGCTYNFFSGNTYSITSNWQMLGATNSAITLKSGTVSSVTYISLSPGSTQQINNVKATDIDSSGGTLIYNKFNGSLARTINWSLRADNLLHFFFNRR